MKNRDTQQKARVFHTTWTCNKRISLEGISTFAITNSDCSHFCLKNKLFSVSLFTSASQTGSNHKSFQFQASRICVNVEEEWKHHLCGEPNSWQCKYN